MDLSRWALPLDAYAQHDLSVPSRALMAEYAACLSAGGTLVELEEIEIATLLDQPTAVTNTHGRRLFDESIAHQYGYRYEALDHMADLGVPDNLPSEGESELAERCSTSNGSSFPPYPAEVLQFGLAAAAYQEAKEEAGVIVAAAVWRECLGAGEEVTIPSDPTQIPDEAVNHYLEIVEHDSVRTVSERERTFAMKDARCRTSSGHTESLYAAEYALSLKALQENRAELDRERAAYEVFFAYASEVVQASPQ